MTDRNEMVRLWAEIILGVAAVAVVFAMFCWILFGR
jgi:hypothetical protein